MADKKISALTAATTPLAGTEVLPVVQGGSTVKVSVANLTAGRATNALKQSVASFTPDGGGFIHEASAASVTSRYWRTANDVSAWADWALQQSTDNTGAAYTTRFYFDGNGNATVSSGNIALGTAGKGIDFSANTNAPGMTSEVLTWYEEGDWTPSYSGWSVDPTTAYAKYTRVGRLVTLHYVAENGTAAAASGVIGGLPFTSNAQQGASVAMKDTSFNSPGVTAFATIGPSSTNIQSMTAANFAGLYWAFSATYMV